MIVKINSPYWVAAQAVRLSVEFGFETLYTDNGCVWFGAKDPIERYADWFIQGLQHYNFKYEVETWSPLSDPNPKAELPWGT